MPNRMPLDEHADAFDTLQDLGESGNAAWLARQSVHHEDRDCLVKMLASDAVHSRGFRDGSPSTHAEALEGFAARRPPICSAKGLGRSSDSSGTSAACCTNWLAVCGWCYPTT